MLNYFRILHSLKGKFGLLLQEFSKYFLDTHTADHEIKIPGDDVNRLLKNSQFYLSAICCPFFILLKPFPTI
jgi:hypothetical protein